MLRTELERVKYQLLIHPAGDPRPDDDMVVLRAGDARALLIRIEGLEGRKPVDARELLAAELASDDPDEAADLRNAALQDDDFETHICAALRAIKSAAGQ